MFDRITTVTLNPSIDVTIWLPSIDFVEPVVCTKRKDYPGGKGINVSRALTALGVDNLAVGITGSENKQKLITMLEQDNVRTRLIENPGVVRENLSIILPDSKLMKINFQGFETLSKTLKDLKAAIMESIEGAQAPLVVFAGSLPCNVSKEDYQYLISSVQAVGAMVALDNDFFSYYELKRIRPFIIKPNHLEIARIFGLDSIPQAKLPRYAQELARFIPHVLLSMGEDGLVYCSSKRKIHVKVPSVEVKSTVGAGDSTLAGFIAALSRGEDISHAVRYGAACGTASVQLEGTQTVSLEQVNNLLSQVNEVLP